MVQCVYTIGIARGCALDAHAPPERRKNFGPNLQTKVVSEPPGRECSSRGRARVVFRRLGEIWKRGRQLLGEEL